MCAYHRAKSISDFLPPATGQLAETGVVVLLGLQEGMAGENLADAHSVFTR
jgi:hypothetical protein